MGMDIDAGDLAEGLAGLSDAVAQEAANRWFSRSQELLQERGDGEDYEVFPVVQSGVPPQYDPGEGGYVFGYPHVAAPFFEHGTEPHEIRAKRAEFLAFEWPDAPPAVREMFEVTFPTVFFKRVEHPGTAALEFTADARREAQAWAEDQP
jgi:hypothetical protein